MTAQTKIDLLEIQWLLPIIFSLNTLVLICAIFIVTKMTYSQTIKCTTLSFYPYYTIIGYLICEIIEVIMIYYQVSNYIISPKSFNSIVWLFINTCSVIKFVMFQWFVGWQCFQLFVLWFFMLFQEELDLNVLQVKKYKY